MLGVVYLKQNKYNAALDSLLKCLRIRLSKLGVDHVSATLYLEISKIQEYLGFEDESLESC
jgi:hypothetical protein